MFEAVFFLPVEDGVWHSLLAHSSSDVITLETTDYILKSSDETAGGMYYDHLTPQLQNETSSVPKANTVSECDFAKLDRLLREKPNASTLTLESTVLFSKNKTAKTMAPGSQGVTACYIHI